MGILCYQIHFYRRTSWALGSWVLGAPTLVLGQLIGILQHPLGIPRQLLAIGWRVVWLYVSQAVLAPPSLSYKPITPRPRDRGNISPDPTHDSSRDPSATHTSRDSSARDPGNLRPHDPGKITHDLSRNWSSTMSHNKTRFGRASNPLINTWQIVGTINKTRPLNNQRTRDATRSTKTRLIRARP